MTQDRYGDLPFLSTQTRRAMVNSVDNLATQAGVDVLRRGGSAVDAAIATNAVLAVVLQNQCGLGGDLFALVHEPGRTEPAVLNASGISGSGADAEELRAAGHTAMPERNDVRSATVPGCVDGWAALHAEYGRLPWPELFSAAIAYAADGFPVSYYFAAALASIADTETGRALIPSGAPNAGQILRQPDLARTLREVAVHGRSAFYEGRFGEGLAELGGGLFTGDDLRRSNADWVRPLGRTVWGHQIWVPPPNSQGYLALSAAWMAERLDLPDDPADPAWPHILIEASRQAAYDRPDALHDAADGQELISADRLEPRLRRVGDRAATDFGVAPIKGGTTYLCAVDENGMAVSLMQSLTMAFGSRLVVGGTGVALHNRGIGFTLERGNANAYGPGKRPAHTLTPGMITHPDGRFHSALGTRGGDVQPQVLLQLLTRLVRHGGRPGPAVAAPRWLLRSVEDTGAFHVWDAHGRVRVAIESDAPGEWASGLAARGHQVELKEPFSHAFGHAQVITADDGRLVGAADPRALSGAAAGY